MAEIKRFVAVAGKEMGICSACGRAAYSREMPMTASVELPSAKCLG